MSAQCFASRNECTQTKSAFVVWAHQPVTKNGMNVTPTAEGSGCVKAVAPESYELRAAAPDRRATCAQRPSLAAGDPSPPLRHCDSAPQPVALTPARAEGPSAAHSTCLAVTPTARAA